MHSLIHSVDHSLGLSFLGCISVQATRNVHTETISGRLLARFWARLLTKFLIGNIVLQNHRDRK